VPRIWKGERIVFSAFVDFVVSVLGRYLSARAFDDCFSSRFIVALVCLVKVSMIGCMRPHTSARYIRLLREVREWSGCMGPSHVGASTLSTLDVGTIGGASNHTRIS
jgi:hypothetical protein